MGSRPTFCGSAQVEALVLKYWIGLERVWVVLFQVSLGMSLNFWAHNVDHGHEDNTTVVLAILKWQFHKHQISQIVG